MAVSDHRFVFVFLVMAVAGQAVAAVCTAHEVDMLFTCITPHNPQFFAAFRDSPSVCDRSLISSDLCQSFSQIVTCTNSKPVSDVTCRPSAVAQINQNLQIPCKIEDFVAVCTVAPRINQGQAVAAVCTAHEVDMLFTCITPHNPQFFAAFRDSPSVCDRSLISSDLCQSFSQIVTCTNSKPVSDVTCRPSAVAQINQNLQIPCKIEDFVAVCTDAPRINQGQAVAAVCTAHEVDLLFTCITPHNPQFFAAFRDSPSVCDRSLISSDLCQSFSQIVTCTNSKPVSDVTCRPSAVAQIDQNLQIPCKIEDFVAVCTDAPRINQGNGSRREVVTLPLLMTSLMATFVVTVLSTGGR